MRQPGRAVEERDRDAVLDADLGLAAGLDRRPVGTLEHQRMAADNNLRNLLGSRQVAAQLEAGVDDREQHDAARVWLVGVGQDFPTLAQLAGDRVVADRVAGHRSETVAAFYRLLGAREAGLGEQRRGEAVLGGVADADALRHAAEALDEPGRLGRRVA